MTTCACDTFFGKVTFGASVGIGASLNPGTERLIVGNGGVDLTSPALNPAADAGLGLSYESDGGRIQTFQSRPLILNPLGNNVGIGTTSPTYPLDVAGTIRTSTGLIAGGAILLPIASVAGLMDSSGTKRVADENGCYYAS